MGLIDGAAWERENPPLPTRKYIIIPARYQSSRFPGKPLATIRGADGVAKTALQRTYERALQVAPRSDVYIATDDHRILDHAQKDLGANAIITSTAISNGTERCAAAARVLGLKPKDVVINLQGDAVMTPVSFLMELEYRTGPGHLVAACHTIVVPAPDVQNQGEVYAECAMDGHAMTFSRYPIPRSFTGPAGHRWLHLGIYAYRAEALLAYSVPPRVAETAEGLEQLRWLENRMTVLCHQVEPPPYPVIEVNYPDDIVRIEEVMKKWNLS